MKQNEYSSIPGKLENLNNVFYLMVGVPLLLFGWIYLNRKVLKPWYFFEDDATGAVLHIIILVVAGFVAFRAWRKYRKELSSPDFSRASSFRDKEQILAKVNYFITASRAFYGFLTISTLMVVAGFYLSAEEFYIGAYTILLVMYSVYRPTLDRMMKEMKLSKEEKELLFEAWKNPAS